MISSVTEDFIVSLSCYLLDRETYIWDDFGFNFYYDTAEFENEETQKEEEKKGHEEEAGSEFQKMMDF